MAAVHRLASLRTALEHAQQIRWMADWTISSKHLVHEHYGGHFTFLMFDRQLASQLHCCVRVSHRTGVMNIGETVFPPNYSGARWSSKFDGGLNSKPALVLVQGGGSNKIVRGEVCPPHSCLPPLWETLCVHIELLLCMLSSVVHVLCMYVLFYKHY